jgi:hypothetical protein
LTDDIIWTSRIIAITEIDFTGINRTATTILVAIDITTITDYILGTYALFERNRIIDLTSIYKRNKTKRRLVLSPEICISSRNLAISTSSVVGSRGTARDLREGT